MTTTRAPKAGHGNVHVTADDRFPYRPTGHLVCGPQKATRLAWNETSCWVETRADQTLLEDEAFCGELMTPWQAATLAAGLDLVARKLAPARTNRSRYAGKFHRVVPVADGLVTIGIARNWAVLNTDADGVQWFRTSGAPMHREQLRALAINLRAWSRAENDAQTLLECGVVGYEDVPSATNFDCDGE